MAQGGRLEKRVSFEKRKPVARLEQARLESAKRRLFDLTRFLNEYSVMPDSFLLPADYPKSVFFGGKFTMTPEEKAKEPKWLEMQQNKLRSTWFNKVIDWLRMTEREFNVGLVPLEKLETEFRALIKKEEAAASLILKERIAAGEVIALEEMTPVYKGIEKDVSKEFLAEKIRLVYGFDALLKKSIKFLKSYIAQAEEKYEREESL